MAAHPRRSQPIAFKEEEMAHGKRARADAETERSSTNLAPAVTRAAEVWLDSQAGLIHEVDAVTQGWVQRRREMIAALQQSIEDLRNSRQPVDLLRIQQEWFTGSLRCVAADLEAWTTLGRTIWQGTMVGLTEAGQSAAEEVRRAGDSIANDAAEAPMLSTAGSKPRGRRAAGGGSRR
jgi:hypothetical protein